MARSARKSIAGHAASAARKVLPKRTSSARATSTDPVTAPVKKAPAKKAAPAKAATKKSPAKKAAPTKAATKKAPAKKAPAKKAAPAKAAAKKASAKKAPAKKAAPAKAAAKKAPAKKVATTTTASATTAAARATTRKGPARKAPVSRLAFKEGEGAWTKGEIKEVTQELNTERERALATLASQESELAGLMRDSGDGAGHDQADMGAISFERDHELSVVNNERDKLAQIDRALGRIADGSYGTCESCGKPIGKMRAMAFPRATLCLSCKQREERR